MGYRVQSLLAPSLRGERFLNRITFTKGGGGRRCPVAGGIPERHGESRPIPGPSRRYVVVSADLPDAEPPLPIETPERRRPLRFVGLTPRVLLLALLLIPLNAWWITQT